MEGGKRSEQAQRVKGDISDGISTAENGRTDN